MNWNSYRKRLAPFTSLFSALVIIPLAWGLFSPVADADEVITEVVRYDDLNIGSEAGRKTLLRRVTAAVDRVCAKTIAAGSRLTRISESCRREALDAALAQINWPVSPGANAARPLQSQNVARIDLAP